MSLSERLKAAEAVRRARAAPATEGATGDDRTEPVLDLRAAAEPTIDLTARDPDWVFAEPDRPTDPDGGIEYDPVRNGDASLAFGDGDPVLADRRSAEPCPRCGGPTQIDLYDQVHQVVSLSCTRCFHMFRHPG